MNKSKINALIIYIISYLESGVSNYEACYLTNSDLRIILEALKRYEEEIENNEKK